MGWIVRKGAWYSYEGDNVGQGRDNTIQRLIEDAEFAQKVEAQVREKLEIGGAAVEAADVEIEVEDEEYLDETSRRKQSWPSDKKMLILKAFLGFR